MARIEELERRLDDVTRRLRTGVERLVSQIIEEVGRELVPATPVDTGYARGNWRPSLNAPSTSPVSILDPTGQATIARIATVARLYRLGQTAFIVNRAPYIGRLNRGSSPQAPPMFVQLSIEKARTIVLARFQNGVIDGGN